MTVLAPMKELLETRQPSIRSSIPLINQIQQTATENNKLLDRNDLILLTCNKMMQTTLTITQDNLCIAENCKNIFEMMKNHFCTRPATNKTPPSNKKDKKTTTSDLKAINEVLEPPAI